MSNQATGNSAHQPREGFMAPTFRIFVRTAEGAHLDEARGDPSYTLDDIEDLKAELHHLEREFSLTGVTSEYDL